MFRAIEKWRGRLDAMVHNAGNVEPALLVRMQAEKFDEVIRTHLKGGFLCTRAAARIMIKKKKGSIIYIGSMLGPRGVAGECNYAAAKAGLIGLAKSAARELGKFKICVNVVFPGYMLTKMGREAGEKVVRTVGQENVLSGWTDPDDSARMIVALSGAPWISGQVFNLDGRIL